jgi:EAL domain-containing protein (putative c-di-GMP-specific phosphodiesterase class I)
VTEQKLEELKRMGFALALDDFGVGRSSLNRLCTLPFDLIKVDRTFIQSLERGESQVLVRAIKTVAEDLGMEVVAEGVETEAQRAWLIDLGFRLGQGFLFDHALPPEEVERRFASSPDPVVAG